MKRVAPAARQVLIRGLLHQRVLEGVARVGRRAGAEQQLGADDPRQRLLQRGIGLARDGAQQLVRELAPDHGADLRQLARGA